MSSKFSGHALISVSLTFSLEKMIKTSIVIPLHDNWQLTRDCLKSLARTVNPNTTEILVIDNSSSGDTAQACGATGSEVFGKSFHYLGNAVNCSFATAANQGARAAAGEFLVFLKNATQPQPGWLEPLLEDFSNYPDIAGTGSIQAVAAATPLASGVMGLGLVFNPWLQVSPLYKGMPLNSPLARKRRFFQAISTACLAFPRQLFLETDGFDERLNNGEEVMDLCSRLWAKGYRFTINPASLVLDNENGIEANTAPENALPGHLPNVNILDFIPDWHLKIKDDGLVPFVTNFGILTATYPLPLLTDLNVRLRRMRPENLQNSIIRYPLWENGWKQLISLTRDLGERQELSVLLYQLFPTPENAFQICMLAMRRNDLSTFEKYLAAVKNTLNSPENILEKIKADQEWCADLGLEDLKFAYQAWLENYSNFKDNFYPSFASDYVKFTERIGYSLRPTNPVMYNLWRKLPKSAKPVLEPDPAISFSILMPVYNPDPVFFKKALDSVCGQAWPFWELCLADDASPNGEIAGIIREYAAKDARIKPFFRQNNGHIAEATNSALALASQPWAVFMDDDDILEPDALAVIAGAIQSNPGGKLFYSDEDKITERDQHKTPHLKNEWDPELLLHQNYVCHLTVMETGRLRAIGGLKNGFSGAQDHELVLRYAEGLPEKAFVHVPALLYSWREHDNSTSKNLASKPYAQESAVKAVQSHLDRVLPGSLVERMADAIWLRVHYPLPVAKPLVSLVMPEIPFSGYQEFLKIRTGYPFEIVSAVAEAQGEILGFLHPQLLPVSQGWLEELVSCLWRPGIGAVGGSLVGMDGRQIHAGYLADSSGFLKPIFCGVIRDPYIGWLTLPRTVKALDKLCLLTRKSDFDAVDANAWSFQDYCLRLGEKGLKTVWWPFAKFVASGAISLPDAPAGFNEKWRLPPFNRNLKIVDHGFALETENVSDN